MFDSHQTTTTLFYGGIGVDSVEWQTAQPITLRSFTMLAHHDNPADGRDANYRGFSRFSLYCWDDTASQWDDVYNLYPSLLYGDTPTPPNSFIDYSWDTTSKMWLCISGNITPTTAQKFRAEFQEWAVWPFMGPAIDKLYGFDVAYPVPEPSTLALLGVGFFGLIAYAFRKRNQIS